MCSFIWFCFLSMLYTTFAHVSCGQCAGKTKKTCVQKPSVVMSTATCISLQFTTCIKPEIHNLHQACNSQLASSLQFTTCIKPAVRNLHQSCSSQLASSLQFATCIKPAVRNLHQACSSQLASSLQFATCIKSVDDNLHQACGWQLASSPLTSCNRLDIIKPEQAMRTHPDIGLMIASWIKSAADLLQLARFWLCI
jgi:hypothetical protein